MTATQHITEELVLKGIPASPGIAIGPVLLFEKHKPVVNEKDIKAEDVEGEIERLRQAIDRSTRELSKIHEFAKQKLGEHQAKIFEAQLMILEDIVLFESIDKRIRAEKKNVEFIVHDEIEKYHRVMVSSTDEYTRDRALDVEDLRNRIILVV